MPITLQDALAKLNAIEEKPVAIEAQWDGDTTGWFVEVWAVYSEDHETRTVWLSWFRGQGGDLRLFRGDVPPWPEAVQAKELGMALAEEFKVPFYFPSPRWPEDECPRWWQRKQGYPCSSCQTLLLQEDDCPWKGMCYHCHLESERERR